LDRVLPVVHFHHKKKTSTQACSPPPSPSSKPTPMHYQYSVAWKHEIATVFRRSMEPMR
jgi:hypothetical protein